MDPAVSLLITSITIIGLLAFDYWDHKLYSDRDDFESYGLFVSNTVIIPLIISTSGLVLFVFMGGTIQQLSLVFLCGGALFTFYINIYNAITIPQRLVMILSKDITKMSDSLPFRMMIIHPYLYFSKQEAQSYLYSLNSKRGIVIPFDDEKSYYEFLQDHHANSNGKCSCCGEYTTSLQQMQGNKIGYTNYQVMDKGGSKIGFANSTSIMMCEDCWRDMRPLVTDIESVEEADLVSELI